MATLTRGALEPTGLSKKDAERVEEHVRARPAVAGCTTGRTEGTERFLREKFARRPDLAEANILAFKAGLELRRDHRGVRGHLRGGAGQARRPAPTGRSPATPRWPTGSSPPGSGPGCRCSWARYPITPASDILHELSKHKTFGVTTFQAEDEIAGIGAALGRVVRWRARGDHHVRARASALKSETDRASRCAWSCRC